MPLPLYEYRGALPRSSDGQDVGFIDVPTFLFKEVSPEAFCVMGVDDPDDLGLCMWNHS